MIALVLAVGKLEEQSKCRNKNGNRKVNQKDLSFYANSLKEVRMAILKSETFNFYLKKSCWTAFLRCSLRKIFLNSKFIRRKISTTESKKSTVTPAVLLVSLSIMGNFLEILPETPLSNCFSSFQVTHIFPWWRFFHSNESSDVLTIPNGKLSLTRKLG